MIEVTQSRLTLKRDLANRDVLTFGMSDIASRKAVSQTVLAGSARHSCPTEFGSWVFHKVADGSISGYDTTSMMAIAKKLDARLNRWTPETAKKVKQLVAEIFELADHDALDLVRSRKVEQEVLDIIDGRKAG